MEEVKTKPIQVSRYMCPICHATFSVELEAKHCLSMHTKAHYTIDPVKFEYSDTFPRGIWLSNANNEAEFYVSLDELRKRFKNLTGPIL